MVTRLNLLRSHLIPLGQLVEMLSLQMSIRRGTSPSNGSLSRMWDSLNLAVTYTLNPRNEIDVQRWKGELTYLVLLISNRLSGMSTVKAKAREQVGAIATEFQIKLYPLIGYAESTRHTWLLKQLTELKACPHYPFPKGINGWRTLVRNMSAEELTSEYSALGVPLKRVSSAKEFASNVGVSKVPERWRALVWHFEHVPEDLVEKPTPAKAECQLLKPGVSVSSKPDGTLVVKATKEKPTLVTSNSPAVKGKRLPKAIQELLAAPTREVTCYYTELPAAVQQAYAWLEEPIADSVFQTVYNNWVLEQEKAWAEKELKKHFSDEQIELIRKSLPLN